MRVLAQPTSASSCERNWSAYDFVHSKSRNQLRHARADKLVYVFSNLRLLTHATAGSYQEAQVGWQYADAAAEGADHEESDSQADPTSEEEEEEEEPMEEFIDQQDEWYQWQAEDAEQGMEALAAAAAAGAARESTSAAAEEVQDDAAIQVVMAASDVRGVGEEQARRGSRERRQVIRD